MLLLSLFLTPPAVSAAPPKTPPSAPPSSVWDADLVPAVEAAAGRRFEAVPAIRFATATSIAERQARIGARQAEVGFSPIGGPHGETTEAVLGDYLPATQEIWIPGRDPAVGSPSPERLAVARCAAAHGLVHALHHQLLPHVEGENADVTLYLREGHAHAIARRVCGDEGTAAIETALGIDVLASLPPTSMLAFAHGYTTRFVGALDAAAGTEAVWAVLAGAVPPRELVERIGAVGLVPGWGDASVLAPAASVASDVSGSVVEAGPIAPSSGMMPLVAGVPATWWSDDRTVAPIPATAGLTYTAKVGDHRVGARAFLLADEAVARAWVARRSVALRKGTVRTFFQPAVYPKEPGRVVRAADGLSATRPLAGDWAYHERWAVRGRRLYGMAVEGVGLRAEAVHRAHAALVALDLPEHAVGELSADDLAALRALAPAVPAPAELQVGYRWALVISALMRDDWAGCVKRVEDVLAALPPAQHGRLPAGGFWCAGRVDDVDAALRFYRLIPDPLVLNDLAVVRLFEDLLAVGRDQEVLDHLPATLGPRREPSVATLRLRANVALGRWDEVERLVFVAEVPAESRRDAARALAKVGRTEVATRAMWAACAGFEGSVRATCEAEAGRM